MAEEREGGGRVRKERDGREGNEEGEERGGDIT